MAVVEHSFVCKKMKMFCELIHFLLVNMNCFCISTVNTLFETQERQRFNYTTFVNVQTRCVFLFPVIWIWQ